MQEGGRERVDPESEILAQPSATSLKDYRSLATGGSQGIEEGKNKSLPKRRGLRFWLVSPKNI